MPIFSWVALVFIVTAATVYSAPNLQKVEDTHNTESNPKLEASSSSEGYLSNDAIAPNRRDNKGPPDENGFAGYLFDETICKIIHNRILCGYDRNKVEYVENEHEVVDIGNGCFIRNDRIECGYFEKEKSVYLRFKSIAEINEFNNTILSVSTRNNTLSSTIKQQDVTIPEEATTTILSTSLPVSSSEATTDETLTEQRERSSDTILLTTILKPISSNHPSTEATMKEFDTTISSSSTILNFIANLTTDKIEVVNNVTDLDNRSKVENTNLLMLLKLKRSIEQTREEKASSKCSECPLQVLQTDTKTFSPTEINTLVVYSRRANMDIKYVRYGSDNVSTKTACVDKDDRIVCYNYKAI